MGFIENVLCRGPDVSPPKSVEAEPPSDERRTFLCPTSSVLASNGLGPVLPLPAAVEEV
jgi:hypothetical protein